MTMRGVYTVSQKISSLNAAKTLVHLAVPSSKVVEILSAEISNASNETNEQCEAVIQKITTNGSPAGTSLTPTPMEAGDQATGVTVLGNLTTEPTTYGSGLEFGRAGFTSLGGWRFEPVPEERPALAPSSNWGLRLLNSPTAFDCVVRLIYREIG